ncbi:MAG: site-2 protease family protein [Anaerolineae bacterium]|nr:site-2 protease family protein [Anaerolineae bacterium]
MLLLLLQQIGNLTPIELFTFMIALLIATLIGMTVHEFAHNYVGHLMGDPNPARQGRLTLNPLVHIYPAGFLMFLIIGFGILGTAPIAAHRMRNPRWGYLAAVAAGPFSNLLIACVVAVIIRIIGVDTLVGNDTLFLFLRVILTVNVGLFLFNLLPLFPIDGWWMVLSLLPADLAHQWERHAQTTQYVFIGLLFLSFALPAGMSPFGLIIGQPFNYIATLLLRFGLGI